jgi:hypothetical protein
LDVEVGFLDKDVRPHPVEELVLGNELPGALYQHAQEIERTGTEFGWLAVYQQLPLARQQLESIELQAVGHGR